MNSGKQFIAIRIDVGPGFHQCQTKLEPLGLEAFLVLRLIVIKIFQDRQTVFDIIERLSPVVYQQHTAYIQQVINEISEDIFFRICMILPSFNPNKAEMIPVSDGNLDCLVYIELNDYTRAIIPPQFCQTTFDAVAVHYVAGQYRF